MQVSVSTSLDGSSEMEINMEIHIKRGKTSGKRSGQMIDSIRCYERESCFEYLARYKCLGGLFVMHCSFMYKVKVGR